MKTITNEIRAKVMAPYVGVAKYDGFTLDYLDLENVCICESSFPIEVEPLSSITDEDAGLCAFDNANDFDYLMLDTNDIDILRQLGYATPFHAIVEGKVVYYLVEDLVELGVYKLI